MTNHRGLLGLVLFLISLGSSMYGLFLPIYFLGHGVGYIQVLVFLISYAVGGILSGFFSNLIMSRVGVRIFIMLRGLLEPCVILLILFYPEFNYPLLPIGILYGFISYAFWISMDILTIKLTDAGKRGSQQGNLYLGMYIALIIAPFIGGFIIDQLGYPALYVASFALVLGGGLLSLGIPVLVPVKQKLILYPKFKGEPGLFMILMVLRGFSLAVTAFLIGLFIYRIFNQEIIVGTFGLIFGITGFISIYLSSKIIDKVNKKTAIAVLLAFTGVSWILLGLGFSEILLYVILVGVNFFFKSVDVPFNTLFFSSIEKQEMVVLVSERIIAVSIGAAIILFAAIFCSWAQIFIITGLSCLISVPVVLRIKAS